MRIAYRPIVLILLFSSALFIVFAGNAFPQVSEPILTIETGIHSSMIRDMEVDARNRILLTGSNDKTVRIWDLSTGKLLKILRPPIGQGTEGIIHAVTISPDGNTIACGGSFNDGKSYKIFRNAGKSYNIFFFDRESGRLIKRVSGLQTAILSLRFSKDGHRLAAGLWGNASLFVKGGLRVFSFERRDSEVRCTLLREDRDYQSHILGIDFSAEGRLVASSLDGSLRLYDEGVKLIATQPAGERPEFVKFSPDGKRIALGHLDVARVDIFSATDLSRLLSPDIPKAIGYRMPAVSWSADGKFLYAAGFYWHDKDNVIVRWDAVDFKSYQYIPVKTRTLVRSIVALPDGGIAYISLNGDLYVLDGKERKFTPRHPMSIITAPRRSS